VRPAGIAFAFWGLNFVNARTSTVTRVSRRSTTGHPMTPRNLSTRVRQAGHVKFYEGKWLLVQWRAGGWRRGVLATA